MKENTGKTKYVILGLLAHSPQTGYTMKKAIEFEYSHFWQESYGQIYPALKQLVDEGLAAEAGDAETDRSRGQKVYRITDSGRAELKRWLTDAPEVEKLRYEILLKVSFGSDVDPEVTLGHLDDFIERNEKLVKDMEGFIGLFEDLRSKGQDHTYHELTALCGKYVYGAMKDWAVEAKKIILDRRVEHETKNP